MNLRQQVGLTDPPNLLSFGCGSRSTPRARFAAPHRTVPTTLLAGSIRAMRADRRCTGPCTRTGLFGSFGGTSGTAVTMNAFSGIRSVLDDRIDNDRPVQRV